MFVSAAKNQFLTKRYYISIFLAGYFDNEEMWIDEMFTNQNCLKSVSSSHKKWTYIVRDSESKSFAI